MDRREFLTVAGAVSALPFTLSSSPLTANQRSTQSSYQLGNNSYEPWLEINKQNLQLNAERIYQATGRQILAVLKDNAYGHGVAGAAHVLEELPYVYGFAVVKIAEAVELRAGGINKPVLLMGPASNEELEELIRQDIMPAVYFPIGAYLQKIAEKLQKKVKVHLYIDTGMSRAGVPYYVAEPVARDIAVQPDVIIDGMMTELTESSSSDSIQISRFQNLKRQLQDKGVDPGKLHAASSNAIFSATGKEFDLVRPGLALFGGYSGKPTLSLKARVMYVKQLRKGDWVQYGRAYVATKAVWIATIPIGHSDGLPSAAVNRCSVMVNGKKYPIIAMVSANHCIIEVGNEKTVNDGDEAVFFGQAGNLSVSAESFAAQTSTNIYQFLMRFNPALRRVYV